MFFIRIVKNKYSICKLFKTLLLSFQILLHDNVDFYRIVFNLKVPTDCVTEQIKLT